MSEGWEERDTVSSLIRDRLQREQEAGHDPGSTGWYMGRTSGHIGALEETRWVSNDNGRKTVEWRCPLDGCVSTPIVVKSPDGRGARNIFQHMATRHHKMICDCRARVRSPRAPAPTTDALLAHANETAGHEAWSLMHSRRMLVCRQCDFQVSIFKKSIQTDAKAHPASCAGTISKRRKVGCSGEQQQKLSKQTNIRRELVAVGARQLSSGRAELLRNPLATMPCNGIHGSMRNHDTTVLLDVPRSVWLPTEDNMLFQPCPGYRPRRYFPHHDSRPMWEKIPPMKQHGVVGACFAPNCSGEVHCDSDWRAGATAHCCAECTRLLRNPRVIDLLDSGRERLTSPDGGYDRMSNSGLIALLQNRDEALTALRNKAFFGASRSNMRLSARDRRIAQLERPMTGAGDFGVLCRKACLKIANASEKSVPVLLTHMLANLGNKRVRTNDAAFAFFDAAYSRHGSAVTRLLRLNSSGPTVRTIQKRIQDLYNSQSLPLPLPTNLSVADDKNLILHVKLIASVMQKEMAAADIKPGTLSFVIAEDETAIIERLRWLPDRSSDMVLGACGEVGHTECDAGYSHTIGFSEDGAAHQGLVSFLSTAQAARYLRCIMAQPLCQSIAPLPLAWHPTCLRFDHTYNYSQLKRLRTVWNRYCLKTIGPLSYSGSDGDSRRRKIYKAISLNAQTAQKLDDELGGQRFCPPAQLTALRYSGVEMHNSGCSWILTACGSDFRHNIGKWVNLMHSPARLMRIGTYSVTCVLLNTVLDEVTLAQDTGVAIPGLRREDHPTLTKTDRQRKDTMDKRSAQRFLLRRVIFAVRAVAHKQGHGHASDVICDESKIWALGKYTALALYLDAGRQYTDAFFSPDMPISSRCERVFYCIYFINLWRDSIMASTSATLTEHFLTRETFTDWELSLNEFMLCLIDQRDNKSQGPGFFPWLLGSNCVEDQFAHMCTFRAQRRVMDVVEATRIISSTLRTRLYGSDPISGVKLPGLCYNTDYVPDVLPGDAPHPTYNPKSFPTNDVLLNIQKVQLKKVQARLAAAGCKPTGSSSAKENAWWYKPKYTGVMSTAEEKMVTDDEVVSEEGANIVDDHDVTVLGLPHLPDGEDDEGTDAFDDCDAVEESVLSAPLATAVGHSNEAGGAGVRGIKFKLKVPDGNGGFISVHKDKYVTDFWQQKEYDSHASADRLCRITGGVRRAMSAMVAMGNLEHGPSLILTGHTAVIVCKKASGSEGYEFYFGDLEHAVRCGKRRVIFSYLLRGHTDKVRTTWSWYRHHTDPVTKKWNAINLDDPTTRYVRSSAPDWDGTYDLSGSDMLPIVVGTNLQRCDLEVCCGRCFTAPEPLLNELKAWLAS